MNFKSRAGFGRHGLPPRRHPVPRFLPSRTIIYGYGLATGYGSWFIVYIGRQPRFARHSLNPTGTGSARPLLASPGVVRLNALRIGMAIKPLWIATTCLDCNRTFVAKRGKCIALVDGKCDFCSSTLPLFTIQFRLNRGRKNWTLACATMCRGIP